MLQELHKQTVQEIGKLNGKKRSLNKVVTNKYVAKTKYQRKKNKLNI